MKWKGKIDFDGRPEYDSAGLITSAEVDTISGTLQTNIDGKSDTSHLHDDRYYIESEVDTISGSLQINIDGKSDTSHLHDDRYYTETELNNGQLDTRYYTESEVDGLITTVSGKLDDHNELNNLDYASAGHTGFQPSGDYASDSELTTLSGNLQTNIDGKDNYSNWSFAVDGSTKDAITSTDVLDFVGGDNITIIRSAEDQITISGSAGGGGGLSWEVINTDTNAVNGSGYLINAGGGNITLTLPISPSEGDTIGVCDIYEKATTNVITIARNGNNIEAAAEDLILDVDGSGFTTVYADATRGWEIVSEIGPGEDVVSDTVYGTTWSGVTGTAPSKNAVYDEMETKADKGANSDITSMSGITGVISTPTNLGSKTTATWSKSIGSGGDYATWAAMIADMPNLIAHAVTVTIKAGTTLTETCDLKNKHGITNIANITVEAEKYFPTSGVIPTADSATATTLRDAALATAVLGNDYFNGCWIFIVDGTGTDNGFVPITDYVDATGDVVVANWPGTQPDNTSRYLIVGALVDGGGTRTECIRVRYNSTYIIFRGIGVLNSTAYGVKADINNYVYLMHCGAYSIPVSGVYYVSLSMGYIRYSGIVNCNTVNNSVYGGVKSISTLYCEIRESGFSDNLGQGIIVEGGGYLNSYKNFGDNNGSWGTYARNSGQAFCTAPECSGSSGNHSDPGTAGTAGADQAAAY